MARRCTRGRNCVALKIAAAVVVGSSVCRAGNSSFTNSAGGNWSVNTNWTSNALPSGSTSTAFITFVATSPLVVNLDTNVYSLTPLGEVYLNSPGTADVVLNVNIALDGMNAATIIVGDTGRATYNLGNGDTTVATTLTLGNSTGGNGTFNLSGNGIILGQLTTTTETVGAAGVGVFNQTGSGVATIGSAASNNGLLTIAQSGTGLYSLSGTGTLTVNGSETLGQNSFSSGSFIQSGGTHLITGSLALSASLSSHASYALSGGTLTVPAAYVGYNGPGTFTQSGGTANLTTMQLGASSAISTYSLGGTGLLNSTNQYIGFIGGTPGVTNDIFTQSGGANTVGNLAIALSSGTNAAYSISGGTVNAGTIFIGGSGVGSFSITGGTVNTIGLTVQSANSSLSLGGTGTLSETGSLTLGVTGAAGFTQTGGVHSLTSSAAQPLILGNLTGSTGTYTLSNGSFVLSGSSEADIGYTGTGNFTQSGGSFTATIPTFSIAAKTGSQGNYSLSGAGLLTVHGQENIGDQGTATFSQSGGTHTADAILLGNQPGSRGAYQLSGGTLNATSTLIVGEQAPGSVTQSGGTANFVTNGSGAFVLGSLSNVTGTYSLSNSASLTVSGQELVGNGGIGSFAQSGGLHTIGSPAATSFMYLGNAANSQGFYSLSGTASQLTINGQEFIGGVGSGTFTQTGGTHVVTQLLELGQIAPGSGTYNLSGGTLQVGFEGVGGNGSGSFVQSGGIHQVSSSLVVGESPLATGSYLLSAGVLNVTGAEEVATGSGTPGVTGTFTQTGGTHSVALSLELGVFGASGSFSLSDSSGPSTLSVGSGEYIGVGGSGTFTQSGGAHTVNGSNTDAMILGAGSNSSSSGVYNLSAGTLTVNASAGLQVGGSGSGAFVQTGGTNSIATTLSIGQQSAGGQYTLSGGTLTAATIQNGHNGVFSFSGGAIAGPAASNAMFVNAGSFIYTAGTFNARLVNQGLANISVDFAPADGIENDATLTLNHTTTVSGFGLDNFGTLTIDGGTLTGNGPVVNDISGLLTIRGTVTNSLTNKGTLNPNGLLTASGTNVNTGVINLPAGALFRGNLGNGGLASFSGGGLAGAVANNSGGRIAGGGSLSQALSNNSGGVILANSTAIPLTLSNLTSNSAGAQISVAENASLNIGNTFTNSGLISLEGPHSLLGTAGFTNAGTVSGQGQISGPISNNSILRAEGGQLTFASPATNAAAGQIQAPAGATAFYSSGLSSNAGTIGLSGGTFDNNNLPVASPGTISGNGTIRSGGLTSTGTITVADGPTSFFGSVTNSGTLKITNNTTTFYGNVTNSVGATFKTTGATARFLGTFTNNGNYNSDPADNFFADLAIGPQGYLTGGVGDRFFISGDFSNFSTQSALWNTLGAELALAGSPVHHLSVAGADMGNSYAGYLDNFALGTLLLAQGESLVIEDANGKPGGGLYVSDLQLQGGLADLAHIQSTGVNLYYDPDNSANAYLAGGSYALAGGGTLAPVPEPAVLGWLAIAAAGLLRRRRWESPTLLVQ